MIFGSKLVQSVLYRLVKEFSKKTVLRKNNNKNGESCVELMGITAVEVLRITPAILAGDQL